MLASPVLLLALLAAFCATSEASDTDSFTPLTVTLQQLQSPDASTLDELDDAIKHVGLFTVTDWEDRASGDAGWPFYGALDSYVACERGPLRAATSDDTVNRIEMDDGTSRHTVATATKDGTPLPLPVQVVKSCPAFAAASDHLRRSVDAAGQAYGQVLERLVYGGQPPSPTSSFAAAAERVHSLEHFHVFLRDDTSPTYDVDAMLSMHTDLGLFIVMTVAEYVDRATGTRLTGADRPAGAGLVLELAPGYRVTPVLPEGALVVMNGEAAVRWMRAGALAPRALLHEVRPLGTTNAARAWFGRMYFPPAGATLRVEEGEELSSDVRAAVDAALTFGDYIQGAYEAFRRGDGHAASAAGCAPGAPRPGSPAAIVSAQRSVLSRGSCKTGQVYCWMQCWVPSKTLKCTKAAMVCRNPTNGKIWPKDYTVNGVVGHCNNCRPQCKNASGGYYSRSLLSSLWETFA